MVLFFIFVFTYEMTTRNPFGNSTMLGIKFFKESRPIYVLSYILLWVLISKEVHLDNQPLRQDERNVVMVAHVLWTCISLPHPNYMQRPISILEHELITIAMWSNIYRGNSGVETGCCNGVG
jgi:hypothetical protein